MRILAATDGSDYSQKALAMACSIASKERDEIMVVTVVEEYRATDLLDDELVMVAGACSPLLSHSPQERETLMCIEIVEFTKEFGSFTKPMAGLKQ